jgi:DNA-binding response OmpR family regulator
MPTASHGRPTRILLVDDDLPLVQGLSAGLRSGGCEVVGSVSYADARERLRDESFDVLLTDIRLGAFNGLQLAVIARQSHADLRIIVMSGFDDVVLRAEAAALQADYLVKPVCFSQILELAAVGETEPIQPDTPL